MRDLRPSAIFGPLTATQERPPRLVRRHEHLQSFQGDGQPDEHALQSGAEQRGPVHQRPSLLVHQHVLGGFTAPLL
eukprot:495007-Hanusia_phi.AAC.1